MKSATKSVTSISSQYIYNKSHGKFTAVYLLCHHDTSTHVFRDVILYATLRGCISVGDALIDVRFSLLGLSYSLAHTYKFLKKLFFSCTVDFKQKHFYILNNTSRKPLPLASYRSCTPANNFQCTEQAYKIPDFISFQSPGNRF